uniref:Protein kinase domain-containing protein n=1 Tax=Kalanchoe fedtschenkoi TaxID=63787 RepID=A0A7N0RBB8_KALFE
MRLEKQPKLRLRVRPRIIPSAAFLAFYLLALPSLVGCQQCSESRCSSGGPPVRFPFRIVGRQAEHCGYPGFDLACTEDGKTKLSLSFPVSFFIDEISYAANQVQIHTPDVCFAKQLLNLDLEPIASSLLHLAQYTLYNCSSRAVQDYSAHVVPCLAGRGTKVIAVGSYYFVLQTLSLVGCTKMYDVSYPSNIFSSRVVWQWSIPEACIGCESDTKICSRTAAGNQTAIHCFDAPRRSSSRVPVIIGTIAGISVLFVAAGVIVVFIKRSSESEKDADLEKFLEDYKERMPTRFTYTDIRRMTNNFKTKLGQGGYGTVYKGKLPSGTFVAVKVLDYSKSSGEDLVNEVATMAEVHHVNVVRLVGFCADGLTQALVFEYLTNGSLDKHISSPMMGDKTQSLDWKKLHEIAVGTAKGIEYLHHGCDHRILHFDIKPHNILLDPNFIPKVCDFGQAKLCAKDQSAVSLEIGRGTRGYIAPEVYSRNFGSVSTKSDVYSFGMLLLEMVGATTSNFSSTSVDSSQTYVPERVYNLMEQGGEMGIRIEEDVDRKIVKKLAMVGLWCTQWSPVERPSMKGVVQMLEGDGDSLSMPPKPLASANSQVTKMYSVQARNLNTSLDIISEIE